MKKDAYRVHKEKHGTFISDGNLCIYQFPDNEKADSIVEAVTQYDDMRELLQRSLALSKQNIDDCGPCDHGVNICVCPIIRLADDIESVLGKGHNND